MANRYVLYRSSTKYSNIGNPIWSNNLKELILLNETQNELIECPECGKKNDSVAKFCKFCGANMELPDFQPFEISQTMQIRRGVYSICCVIFIVLVFYLALVVFPNAMPPAAAVIASTLFMILLGGVSFISLIYILVIYRSAGKRRIFSISPKSIRVVLPREPVFEINWSKFDTIELKKWTGSQNQKLYRFYFILHGIVREEILIKGSMHFSGANCRTIVSKLHEYALKMNKQFIQGKKR